MYILIVILERESIQQCQTLDWRKKVEKMNWGPIKSRRASELLNESKCTRIQKGVKVCVVVDVVSWTPCIIRSCLYYVMVYMHRTLLYHIHFRWKMLQHKYMLMCQINFDLLHLSINYVNIGVIHARVPSVCSVLCVFACQLNVQCTYNTKLRLFQTLLMTIF